MAEITGILLAAGAGQRFGGDKLLASLAGEPLIAHSARALAPCDRVIAIVRDDDLPLQGVLDGLGMAWTPNPVSSRGIGRSIACAVMASAASDGWLILPADMPCVAPDTSRHLVAALRAGKGLVAPRCNGRRGHPVGFAAAFYDELIRLDGDQGGRQILARYPERLTELDIADPGVLCDVDTANDLAALRCPETG
jgi:molybdenum cofactor cytidylyltransferase